MTREKRLAGRAIRKARREERERFEDLLAAMPTFTQAIAAAFDALAQTFVAALEAVAAAAEKVARSFAIAARERARREFEWRLSFRALEAPRHEHR